MEKTIYLPDVGDLDGVEVVEVFVKVGESIAKEQTIITLEGSKASMEVPAPEAGVVKEVLVNVGDEASDAMALIVLTSSSNSSGLKPQPEKEIETQSAEKLAEKSIDQPVEAQLKGTQAQSISFTLPDVGDLDGVEVVEVFVKAGESIVKEQTIITLEGSKASMEIPAPLDGVIESISVQVGDAAKEDMVIAVIKTGGLSADADEDMDTDRVISASTKALESIPSQTPEIPLKSTQSVAPIVAITASNLAHASPSVRKLARVLGVDLLNVTGSGLKNRISRDDVKKFVKSKMQSSSSASGAVSGIVGLPSIAKIDFEKFGPVEYKKLNKIKTISAQHLQASWLNIPHVTQYADVNAESLESYRQAKKTEIEKQGYKLTPLILIMKAVVKSLKEFPNLNSSFADGQLVLKQYYNIGIAVDTSEGLVVPVVRNVDEKSVFALAKELSEISQKARSKKLNVTDMTGGTFTISNLGGVGAAKFTPIVNAPEVAILGLSRSYIKPVFSSGYFMPQLTMPLSLSYDHRVIDGAEGARFMNSLAANFLDIASVV